MVIIIGSRKGKQKKGGGGFDIIKNRIQMHKTVNFIHHNVVNKMPF